MLKFRISGKDLRVSEDTKFRVEWNHPLFTDDIVAASIIYPFEVPAAENVEIFGYLNTIDEKSTVRSYTAEVLWLDGSWLRGSAVVQRFSRYKYAIGIALEAFPGGFGEKTCMYNFPKYDFGGYKAQLLYEFAQHAQGDNVAWGAGSYKVHVQAPVLVSEGGAWPFRNLKNPAGDEIWTNTASDDLVLYNKKTVSPALYLKSALGFVFSDFQIGGSWLENDFLSELLVCSPAVHTTKKLERMLRMRCDVVRMPDHPEIPYYWFWSISPTEIIDPDGYLDGAYGTVAYAPNQAGTVCFFPENSGILTWSYYPISTTASFDIVKTVNGRIYQTGIGLGDKLAVYFVAAPGTTPAGDFWVNFYMEAEELLQKEVQEIELGSLVPQGATYRDLLHSTLPGLGAVVFADSIRKIVEFTDAESILKSKSIDISAQVVDWYGEPTIATQTAYQYGNAQEFLETSLELLKYALPSLIDTNTRALELATGAVYEAQDAAGRLLWKRLQAQRDAVNVRNEITNSTAVNYGITPCEDVYLSDFAEVWESNADFGEGEIVFWEGKIWISKIASNDSEPGADANYIELTNDRVAAKLNGSGWELVHFKNLIDFQPTGTATRFDKNGVEKANFDLKMSGEKGMFSNFLSTIDTLRNSTVYYFQLDDKVDIEKIKLLFSPQLGAEKFRKFLVEDVQFVPVQFSCVLSNNGIEDAQMKGVRVYD